MSPVDAIKDTFRALRVRNYRLFTTGQLVSLSGTWMQTVAQSWLVLRLTGSGVALGVVTALQFLPTALGGLWAGLVADRFSKRAILIWTQSLSGALALVLGVLTATGSVRLWMIYALALLLGSVTALDTPARQAFVVEMVGEDDVANAIGINSAVFNTARIVGPALAAAVIAVLGLSVAFILNGLSYLGPVAALTAMDPRALRPAARAERGRGMLREGIRYALATRSIRRTLLVLGVIATFGFNFTVIVPMLARFTFGGSVSSFAVLTSLLAGGGLIGALWVARRGRPTQRLLAVSASTFGFFALLSAFAPNIVVAGALLAVTGAASMAFIATANSTLQLEAPGHLRGRVMAIYALIFLGSTPVGAPVMGWISEHWGPRVGIGAGGAASLAAGLVALATNEHRAEHRADHRADPRAQRLAEPQHDREPIPRVVHPGSPAMPEEEVATA